MGYCPVPWCGEDVARHGLWHERVLLSTIQPAPGSPPGAFQIVLFASDDDAPRVAFVIVNGNLAPIMSPDHLSVALSWRQVEEVSALFTMPDPERPTAWTTPLARNGQPGSLSIKPSAYDGPLELTVAELEPAHSLTLLLSQPLASEIAHGLEPVIATHGAIERVR